MPGPVVADHADLEEDCENCHDPLSDRPQGELCIACHTEIGVDVNYDAGFHGRLPTSQRMQCSSCHTDHEGRDQVIAKFDEATFDHALTDFFLFGAHLDVACVDCHVPGELHRSANTTCIGCHRADDPHKGQLGDDCKSCHNATSWIDAKFDHKGTRFPLTGAHVLVDCSGCHRSDDFSDVGQTCVACHRSDDVHEGRNGTQCAQCHSTTNWTNFTFDHLAMTGFALDGGHSGLSCQECHRAKDFRDLGGSECNSCHLQDDVHKGKNGKDCESCHGISNWSSVRFNHVMKTGFSLPVGHEKLACESCHADNIHDAVPRLCGACHIDDDAHKGQLGQQCESCHVATSWTAQLWFDHDLTNFPLIGEHAGIACDRCHDSAAFHDTRAYCVACHGGDDPHRGALGNQCDTCHNPANWQAWRFDHDAQSDFPLSGAHVGLACEACHSKPVRQSANIPDDCNSCHRRDDPHSGRFGNNCDSCHTTSSFSQIGGL